MRSLLSIMLIAACFATSWTDNLVTVEATYTFYGNGTQSRDECKRLALQGAKQAALADEFGTIVSGTTMQQTTMENNKVDNYFVNLAETEVKGEWISDIGEPTYKISLDDEGNFIVVCSVKGKAREISNEAVDFTAEVLKNTPSRQAADTDFKQGDNLYLYFQAPADGYMAMYLLDDSQTAWNLLPYSGDSNSIVRVRKGREYYFFDPDNPGEFTYCDVDKLKMTSRSAVEFDEVYVLFSPNVFNKAADERVTEVVDGHTTVVEKLPSKLSLDDFSKWVTRMRKTDKKMNIKRIPIKITNPNAQ